MKLEKVHTAHAYLFWFQIKVVTDYIQQAGAVGKKVKDLDSF
jgi:hypothetical protein